MRAVFVMLLTLMLPALGLAQQTAPAVPQLNVVMMPAQAFATNTYIGAELVMRVQLISRHPYEALELKVPKIDGAETVELLRPRTRKVSSYAGEGYVFETAVAVIPTSSGVLNIPPVTAKGTIEPEPDNEVQFDLSSNTLDVKVAGIPSQYGDEWWLVSPRVEVDEEWSKPVEEIRSGEIVQRKVSVRVWGTTADRLPVLEHTANAGFRVSLASSNTRTKTGAEGMIATAEYVWDLEIDPLQVAFIPPVGLTYWHPLEHRRLGASASGLRLEPLPADSEKIAAQLMEEAAAKQDLVRYLILALAGILAIPALVILIAYLMTLLPTRADWRLLKASKNAKDSTLKYRLLCAWIVENGWAAADVGQHLEAYKTLSNQLFGPEHSAARTERSLSAEAWHFARKQRVAALKDRLLRMAGFGTPGFPV